MTSPQVARSARRLAASQKQQAQDGDFPPVFYATVTAVNPGQSRDARATVSVLWRGSTVPANGYGKSYTPTVGDRVLCVYDGAQVVVADSIVGIQ